MLLKFARLLDWVLAFATIGYGLYLGWTEWPALSAMTWLVLGFGVAGLLVAILNPSRLATRLLFRRFVKRG